MIFSENWLRELVDPEIATQDLIDRLTMAGLEVDSAGPVAHQFSGIVVAEVESVDKHPDADKLSVCHVNDGAGSHQVVCGAANVRAGMKAAFATVGAEIQETDEAEAFKIKAARIRGTESNGMLCSAEELGMAERSAGILELPQDANPGMDVRDCFMLDDNSIELDLTPNRGDCLGMIGLAREVGVLARREVRQPVIDTVAPAIKDEFPITISAAGACPRYLGRIIRNIDLNAEAPLWMREKLRRSGLRSIDPIVDVTNYVLMELGQPMHAFDYAGLEGGIDVRMAKEQEKITLLDGKEIQLSPDVLVIADADKAVAMAGIMGGLATCVTETTRDVFLECACFAPLAVAGKARSYGMHTDASHRYERGVDYQLQRRAIERATQLLLDIVGGEAGPITEATGNLPEPAQVELKFDSIPALLGIQVEREEVLDILQRLGFAIVRRSEQAVVVDVPSFRFDVSIEADLIEEIARIYGYDNVPKSAGLGTRELQSEPEARVSLTRIRQQLVALGYQEVITYSFIDPALSAMVAGADAGAIALENPISEDMSVMRTSLLPGLLATLQYNTNRQHDRLRLFETGLVFSRTDRQITQTAMLGGVLSGSRFPENWSNDKAASDFYDVKGDVESLLALGANRSPGVQCRPAQAAGYHPGQCARVETAQGRLIGHLGGLHPLVRRKLGLDSEVFLFELCLEQIRKAILPRAAPLSRFPEVSRDLAIVIAETVPADAVLQLIRKEAGDFVTDLRIFDVYQGDAVTKGKKSIALGLTWQHPSRTLSDKEINSIICNCVNALQEQFDANLRN